MLIFLTITLLGLISSVLTTDMMNKRLSGRLDGSVYQTLSSMGEIMCRKECVVREKCLSINYERLSLTCEFNTIAVANKTDLTEDQSWIYMDKSDLSEEYGDETCTKSCPNNTTCISMTSQVNECILTECIDPPDVTDASVSLKRVGVSEETVYTCNTYYYLTGQGNGKITCKADGHFTDVNFACALIPCSAPGSNSVANANRGSYQLPVGSTVHYSCHYGYDLVNGPASRTCQLGGSWSTIGFSCRLRSCSAPSDVENASKSVNNTSVGSNVTYTCNLGYSISGSNRRTCQLGGAWTAVAFTCGEIPCPSPPSVPNAGISSFDTTVGSQATYNCANGYSATGATSVVCQLGGTWSGVAFSCD